MEVLIQNFSYITWQMLVMWGIGGAARFVAAVFLYSIFTGYKV